MCRFGEYMQYWGKIIGVAVALLMGGGFWGVVLGLLIGHMFDKARSRKMAWFATQRERQALFFAMALPVLRRKTRSGWENQTITRCAKKCASFAVSALVVLT